MRIASTQPSATEIVSALGASAQLVAISHVCDYPSVVLDRPRLTSPRGERSHDQGAPSGREIDSETARIIRAGLAAFDIDLEVLAKAAPDLVLTQDLCDVCAIDRAAVEAAVRRVVGSACRVENLAPTTLFDVWRDIERVGALLDLGLVGQSIAGGLRARVEAVSARVADRPRPRVLAVEWIDPLMAAGLWMPDIVRAAGGEPVGPASGEPGRAMGVDEVLALSPDIILVKPCGFDLSRTLAEMGHLHPQLASHPRIVVADGDAYFNRPGPRLADSVEILAAALHPEAVPHLVDRHAGHYAAWTPSNPG